MADTTYRANLSAKSIPTDPLLFGRSVIIKDRDNNYAPNLASKSDTDKDIGIPQVLYGANVLPTEFGYKSIAMFGSQEKCPGTPYIAFPIRSETESATLIHTNEGHLYRLKKSSEAASVPLFVYIGTFTGNITYAHVAGVTYIYVANVGCYTYNFTTKVLVAVTLTGLTPSAVIGVTATGGYLLAWSKDAIAWSSLVDATDFVPSLDTGAGGGGVEGAKGAITVCVSNSYGIYVFTASNCISAQLSNNARFPFNFREIVGSSGLDSIQSVSYEGNQNSAYAFTNAGFQQISHNGAKTIWTELHENGLNTPIWNESSTISSSVTQGSEGKITSAKIVTIAAKYVCISTPNRAGTHFNQVWVYDIALDRWGRIVKDHVEVFEDEEFAIAFLTADNRYLKVADPFVSSPYLPEPDLAYLAAGRYQYSRQRLLTMQRIELENLYPYDAYDAFGRKTAEDAYPSVYLLSSRDGKSGSWVDTYRHTNEGEAFASYLKRITGVNHTVLIKGHFNLNSVILTFSPSGGR